MGDTTKTVKYIIQSNGIPTMGIGYLTDRGTWVSNKEKATRYDLGSISAEYLLDDKYQIIKTTTKYKVVKLRLKGM